MSLLCMCLLNLTLHHPGIILMFSWPYLTHPSLYLSAQDSRWVILLSLLGFDEVNACLESGDTFNRVHDLARTLLEGCCDVFVHEESPNVGCDNVLPSPLDHSHVLPYVPNLHRSPSLILMCPSIIIYYVIRMLIWLMKTTCLICLVGMLLTFYL